MIAPLTENDRRDAWRAIGARGAVLDELLAYARNDFASSSDACVGRDALACGTLGDEPFASAWDGYCDAAARLGTVAALRAPLVQLSFPIERGMSVRADYLAATRRGVWPADDASGAHFVRPDGIGVLMHASAAGRIPVIVSAERADFETLVRALTMHNEPDPVPPSMGACIVAGYNNWDRVRILRDAWHADHAAGAADTWANAFRALATQKEQYQDRFVLLSVGAYSAVPARALGLDDGWWLDRSHTIRLEHECAHYVTRRVFGSMRNTLLDELIADYVGIVAAAGRYRTDWALAFFGLDSYPRYRAGARLENYRGSPPLSDDAFSALQHAVVRAVRALERFDARLASSARPMNWRAIAIARLAETGLERLIAAEDVESLDAPMSVRLSA